MDTFSVSALLGGEQIPSQWDGTIRLAGGEVRILGDNTGLKEVFVAVAGDQVLIGRDVLELAAHLGEASGLHLSRHAVSHVLQDGLVAYPRTIFDGIYQLGVGDVGVLQPRGEGQNADLRFEVDFPYFADRSTGKSEPSTRRLAEVLTASLLRQTPGPGPKYLMLSSGKDSTPLAIAAADAGLPDLQAITYVAGKEHDEGDIAAAHCKQLGLRHRIVRLPTDLREIRKLVTAYFENSPMPGTDPVQIPYVMCLAATEGDDRTIIDGSGSDIYVGHLPPAAQLVKFKYARMARALPRIVERCVSHASKASFLFKTPAQLTMNGYNLRFHEARRLYPAAVPVRPFWQEVTRSFADRDGPDFQAAVRGRHYDQSSCAAKARSATAAIGARLSLPWCDQGVIDFYFNLPEAHRFDRAAPKNKVLLRQMLRERIGYDDVRIGKRAFNFDMPKFLQTNHEFVLDEIRECRLWAPGAADQARRWIHGLPRNWALSVALLEVFMLSGWLNHARVLKGSVGARDATLSR